MTLHKRKKGNSAVGFVLFLAVIGYGIFVGIQYVPQYIESNTVRTILDNILEKSQFEPMDSLAKVEGAINNQLFINEMTDLRDSFSVRQYRGNYEITVRYERKLNLGFQTRTMKYEKSVTLQ
jgi:hypothetical protein